MAKLEKIERYTGVYRQELNSKFENKPDYSFYVKYPDKNNNGKIIKEKVGRLSTGTTAKMANDYRNKKIIEYNQAKENGAVKELKGSGSITLNEIFEIYKNVKSDNKDMAKTEQKFKKTKERFGDIPLKKIDENDIRVYREVLLEKYAPASVRFDIGFIGTLYKLAIDKKLYIGSNPVSVLKAELGKSITKKPNNNRDRYLTRKEISELLNAVEGDKILTLFTYIALETGARLRAVLAIKLIDINFEESTIRLNDFKTDKGYTGYLGDKTLKLIKELNLKPMDKVIDMPERTLVRKMKAIYDELFNKDLEPNNRKDRVVNHTLRHTFATQLILDGVSIFVVKNLMNHADIEQTMRYAKFQKGTGKEEVKRLIKRSRTVYIKD